MKKRGLALCIVGILSTLVFFSGCSKKTEATNTSTEAITTENVQDSLKGESLRVATCGIFAPYSYYDADGKTLIGYDLDFIDELQKILGFEIKNDTIQAMPYAALITSATEGKVDLIAAGLSSTDERKKVMSFSDIYSEAASVVLVNKTANTGIESVDDLTGKKIACEKGSISHVYAVNKVKDAQIEAFDSIAAAYEALEQNKVDAVLHEAPPARYYLKTTTNTNLEIAGPEFDKGGSLYALGFQKDSPYVDNFNAAIKILEENGTIQKLNDKWLNQ